MRDVYSQYWISARDERYGFLPYDQKLCACLCEYVPVPARLLEVAIGTGYPFADFLQRAGYDVYGIDISRRLIDKCARLNQNLKCTVGDAEYLAYRGAFFDCVYCFHSTWYFPHLDAAIYEMIRVVRGGGYVFFDIQNRNNEKIASAYRKRVFRNTGIGKGMQIVKNMAKVILGRGTADWSFVVHEVPTFPDDVYEHLRSAGVAEFFVMIRKEDGSIERRKELDAFENSRRLIFCVRK